MPNAAVARRRCANCGATVRAKDRFCGTCGTPLTDAATAPSRATTSASLQVAGHAATLLGEQRKVVTVVFADLSGSTPLGERLDPEELRGILARYFNALATRIARYEGTVDKYIGDAVMAVFGAPVSHEDDAERAINAALAMQTAMAGLNAELEREHGVRLSLRIGINTGEVVAGMLAGDVQAAYTVVGDAVNTAQRIESAAPAGEVVVSATTRRLAIHSFEFEELEPVRLKGKAEPVTPYRVVRRRYEEIAPDASPFVGRERELQFLRDAVVDAVVGRGRVIEVTGEAGVGKSRLVGEFRSGLISTVDRLVVRCASFETNTPYGAIADLFRLVFRIHATDDEPTARAAIAAGAEALGSAFDEMTVSLILDILGHGQASRMDPQTRRRMLVRVIRSLLRVQSERATLVLVIEDLQWLDDASVQTMIEISKDVPSLPILFVGTARPGWISPWPAERIELAAFGEADARSLVEAIFESPVDDTLLATVFQRTGGNAFFVEEVSRELRASDLVAEQTGRVGLRGAARDAVPATIRELLEARIDRLDEGPRRIVQLAAVSGRTFWYRVLQQLAPDRDVAADLALLERESLVAVRSPTPELTYAFRQSLIQEVAYGMQLLSQRRTTHTRVGDAIARLYADRLEEFVDVLAYHYGRGDDDEKARAALMRAGRRAQRLYAKTEAIAYFEQVIARGGDDALLAEAEEAIGDLERVTGAYDAAVLRYEAAQRRRPDEIGHARLRRKSAIVLQLRGEQGTAARIFEEVLAALPSQAHEERARTLLNIGEVAWREGHYDDAEERFEAALGETSDEEVMAEALKQLGTVASHRGDLDRARDFFGRSLAAYERVGDVLGQANVNNNIGLLERRRSRHDAALDAYGRALAIRERIGDQQGRVHSLNNIGGIHYLRGDLDAAIAAFTAANETARAIGYTLGAGATREALGASRVEKGEIERGIGDLRAGIAQIESAGSMPNLVDALCDLANAYAQQRSPAALETATRALTIARELALPERSGVALQAVGRARLALGDTAGARAALEESRALLAPDTHEMARTLALLGGIYRDDPARRDEGEILMTEARATFQKLGAMLDLARMERIVSAG